MGNSLEKQRDMLQGQLRAEEKVGTAAAVAVLETRRKLDDIVLQIDAKAASAPRSKEDVTDRVQTAYSEFFTDEAETDALVGLCDHVGVAVTDSAAMGTQIKKFYDEWGEPSRVLCVDAKKVFEWDGGTKRTGYRISNPSVRFALDQGLKIERVLCLSSGLYDSGVPDREFAVTLAFALTVRDVINPMLPPTERRNVEVLFSKDGAKVEEWRFALCSKEKTRAKYLYNREDCSWYVLSSEV